MIKARKKSISLLVTLVFLLSVLLPAGAAFADDPVTFSSAVKEAVKDAANQELGWAKVTIDDATDVDNLWLTMTLPDGVTYETKPTGYAGYVTLNDTGGVALGAEFISGSDDSITVRVYGIENGDSVSFVFTGTSVVDVDSSADENIYVNVNAKATATGGLKLWEYSKDLLVGVQGTGVLAVDADTPTTISIGTGKGIADITFEETVADAAYDTTVTLTLPDGFEWESASATDVLYFSAAPGISGLNTDELVIGPFPHSSPFAGKVTIEATIIVYPDAPEGDVKVNVECSDDDVLAETSVVVAKLGASEVTVTADADTGDDIYVADTEMALYDITFESSGTFTAGDDLILTLPEGLEWAPMTDTFANINFVGATDGRFDDNKGLWCVLDGTLGDEFTLSGLKVNVAADAPVGDIVVEISGDVVDTSVVAGEVKSRVDVTADKPSVTIGLAREAGDITITETDEDTLLAGDIELTLPTGVTFASLPTAKIGDDELTVDWINSSDKSKGIKITVTSGDLNGSDPDSIVISDVEFDLDTRIAYGDITVDIGGTALNDLGATEVNDTDGTDPVASVANATVVSATAAEAVLTVGSTTMTVNGEEVAMDVAPYLKNSRLYVSARYCANALGVDDSNILWDNATQTATIIKGAMVVQLTVGSKIMKVNGADITMDTAPEIVPPGRVMLPIGWLAWALGAGASWDGATQTATLTVE